MRSPLQVSLSCFNGERKGSNMYSPHFLFSFSRSQTDFTVNVTKQTSIRWVSAGLGVSFPENFQVLRLRNAIFSTCHEICLRKIDLEPENGKQLQVAIIKITESKENNSIHRLNVSGSTGPGGTCPPCSPPPPPASYGSGKIDVSTHEYLTPVNKIIEAMY